MTMHPARTKRIIATRTGVKLASVFGGAALLMTIPLIVSAPRPLLAQGVQLVVVDLKAVAAGYQTASSGARASRTTRRQDRHPG